MARSFEPDVPVAVYETLTEIQKSFERIRLLLGALEKEDLFDRRELHRYVEFIREARGALASYMTGAIETKETDRAGQLYKRRRRSESRDAAR